ncbi:hypothetical protein QEN19_003558 [Hanseniaspora menglaensis]
MSELIFENGPEEKIRVPEAEEAKDGKPQGMEILNNPVHGMYIPTILLISGSLIMYMTTSYKRTLIFIPIAGFLLAYRFMLAKNNRKVDLNLDHWVKFELDDQFIISKDTCIYTFKLNSENQTLNCPPGHSLVIKAYENEETGDILFELPKPNNKKEEKEEEQHDISKLKEIYRFYNPISSPKTKGTFDLLIKSKINGEFSKKIASSAYKGLQLNFKGFIGTYDHAKSVSDYSKLVLFAAGSGITPILQVITKVLEDKEDVDIEIIYCNKTKKDILLKSELDDIVNQTERINVTYLTDDIDGFLTTEVISSKVGNCDETRFLISGPEDFIKHAKSLLNETYMIQTGGNQQVFVF